SSVNVLPTACLSLFSISRSCPHRPLHSFPTRRSSDLILENVSITGGEIEFIDEQTGRTRHVTGLDAQVSAKSLGGPWRIDGRAADRKSTRLNSSHVKISYAVFCLKKKRKPSTARRSED